MSLSRAIAEAVAGGLAGYATVATNKDFLSPLMSGMQQRQDREARAADKAGDRAFARQESEKDRALKLDLVEAEQAFTRAERELKEAHEDTKLEKQQAFQAAQSALTQKRSAKSQQDLANLQAKHAAELTRADRMAVENGDFSGFGQILGETGHTPEQVAAQAAVVGGRRAEKADQKASDSWMEMSAGTLDAYAGMAERTPSQAVESTASYMDRLAAHRDMSLGLAATDAQRSRISQGYVDAVTRLRNAEEGANTLLLQSDLESLRFEGVKDQLGSHPMRVLRAMEGAGWGNNSARNAQWTSIRDVLHLTETLPHVSADHLEHPSLKGLIGMFGDENAPASTVIGQVGRDPDNAAALLRGISNLSDDDIRAEKDRLVRLNTEADFSARAEQGLELMAANYPGKEFVFPPDAFMLNPDGEMQLTARGAESMADMFKGQFTGEGETIDTLEAIDSWVSGAGLSEDAGLSIKKLIANDPERQQELALNDQTFSENLGRRMETTFRRGLVQGFEGLQEAVLGKSDEAAKKALRNRGLGPEYLGYARQGGSYYGDDLVRSLLPDSDHMAVLLEDIDDKITIAEAGARDKEAKTLTDKKAALEGLRSQDAVVLTVRNTLKRTMKAVADGDTDTLYDTVTMDLKNKGFLDIVAAVEESGGKEAFKAAVAEGYSQGNKVQLALEWMVEKQLFKLGRSGEASSAHQDALVNYLAKFSGDIGESIDDSILELDLGATYRVSGSALDTNQANVALRFMTTGAAEMDKFEKRAKLDPQRQAASDTSRVLEQARPSSARPGRF